MWDEWNNNPQHMRDNAGPVGLLQLYVRTDTEILEDDVYAAGKVLRRGDKHMKDPAADALAKARKQIFGGLDEIAEVRCKHSPSVNEGLSQLFY